MPRLTIADMAKAPKEVRPSRLLPAFETAAKARVEDERRARSITNHLAAFGAKEQLRLKKLETHLRAFTDDRERTSCASSVDMREWRDRWPGWLLNHCTQGNIRPLFYTVQPNTWLVPQERLQEVNAFRLLQQLRNDLNKAGARDADGAALFGLDCEYEPTSGTYVFHTHSWVWGGLCDIVEALRHRRKYRHNPLALAQGSGAVNPIRRDPVRTTPLSNATYIGKSYWAERARVELAKKGWTRARGKHRIKGRAHVDMLLWLDRQRYSDLFLTMKLRITRTGFKPW